MTDGPPYFVMGTGLDDNSLDYVIIFQCPALRIRPERRISHECEDMKWNHPVPETFNRFDR